MELKIEKYKQGQEEIWDNFVLCESINGTFLQTRRFIEYHPEGKFKDFSLIVYKGNTIVAVILACEIEENGEKIFFSHKGSTFGGIVIAQKFYSATNVDGLLTAVEDYLKEYSFSEIYLKMTPSVFCKKNADLLDYFLYQRDFEQYDELNYYLDLERYKEDIAAQFSSSKRRDYRYSLKNELLFRKLETEEDIQKFYNVLQLNLKKLGLTCVHKYEELLDLKFNRFDKLIDFYGVFKMDHLIAGSMTFIFNENVMHTQYLASDEAYLQYYCMDFLIYNLIKTSVDKQMKYLTFGICTEQHGKYLNLGLSRFKEGFGTDYCINRSYYKKLS